MLPPAKTSTSRTSIGYPLMGGVLFLAGRGPLHNQSRKEGTIHVLPEDYCPGTAHLHGGRVDHLRHMLQLISLAFEQCVLRASSP